MSAYLERRRKTLEEHKLSVGDHDATLDRLHREYEKKIGAAREDVRSQRTMARRDASDIHNSILEEAKKEGP